MEVPPGTHCDFCFSERFRYTHYCEPFEADAGVVLDDAYVDDGLWAVCVECHPHVVAHDRKELFVRAFIHDGRHHLDARTMITLALWRRNLIQLFFANYHDQWEEGPPAEVLTPARQP